MMKKIVLTILGLVYFTVSIFAQPLGNKNLTQASVSSWLVLHAVEYQQQHLLTCEPALMRLVLGFSGAEYLSEAQVLSSLPQGGEDPEKYFVCDNIDQGRLNKDRSIHWNNYGTHPPVVAQGLNQWFQKLGLAGDYEAREMKLKDEDLKTEILQNPQFLGAIIWVVGHPDRWGLHPQVNERGMVLGEHVRFVSPLLDSQSRLVIWDPEKGVNKPKYLTNIPTRDMFSYRVVAIFAKRK